MSSRLNNTTADRADETARNIDAAEGTAGTAAPDAPQGTAGNSGTAAADRADGTAGVDGRRAPAGKKRWGRILLLLIVIAALGAGGWQYWYNTPAQRMERVMEEAQTAMQEEDYVRAEQLFTDALAIYGTDMAAWEGRLRAVSKQADLLALAEDRTGRVQACRRYEDAISLYDEAALLFEEADPDGTGPVPESYREEAAAKLEELRVKIAAGYETVECTTDRKDHSGTEVLPDGTQLPYTWYYDLVCISDEEYPYADSINAVLEQDMNDFFSNNIFSKDFFSKDSLSKDLFSNDLYSETEGDTAASASGNGSPDGGEVMDYVGEAGILARDGFLSIRMAEVRVRGQEKASFFRGRTFRLSDAAEVTLGEMTGRTDSSLRRLVRRRIWSWLEQEGYREISKSDIEAYVEETDPDDFKFCILPDKGLCLIIDQEASFFSTAQEILEIPLEDYSIN